MRGKQVGRNRVFYVLPVSSFRIILVFVFLFNLLLPSCRPHEELKSIPVPYHLKSKRKPILLGTDVHPDYTFTLYFDKYGDLGKTNPGGRYLASIVLPGDDLLKLRRHLWSLDSWRRKMKASRQQAFEVKYACSVRSDNHVMLVYAANKGSAGCILAVRDGDHTCMEIMNPEALDHLLEDTGHYLDMYRSAFREPMSDEEEDDIDEAPAGFDVDEEYGSIKPYLM